MNDDELHSALVRRASFSLSADERRDILRAARGQALQPRPRPSLMPRLAGLVAGIAAVLVVVLIASPILLSPPLPAAPSGSALANGTDRASPATTAVPQPASLQVYDAEELSKMVGDPTWTGKVVLVQTTLAAVTGPPNAFESPGVFACEAPNACRLASIVDRQIPVLVGWRDATADDGIQYDDGNGYRWLKPLDVPSAQGTYAFVVRSNAVEYLGPALVEPGGNGLSVGDVLKLNDRSPGDEVMAVRGWLVQTSPVPCMPPFINAPSSRPASTNYWCGGSWLTSSNERTNRDGAYRLVIGGGLHTQNGAYEDFAPNPAEDDQGYLPRLGTYLIRSAGCPEVVMGDCPVFRMLGRLEDIGSTVVASAQPLPTPSQTVPTTPVPPIRVSNTTSLALHVNVNGTQIGTSLPGSVRDFDPSDLREPWTVSLSTELGRVVLEMTYDLSQIGTNFGGTSPDIGRSVGKRVDLSCGRLDVSVASPILGPAWPPETSFPPGDCDVGTPSPSESPLPAISVVDLGDIIFQYPTGWTLNDINELQHYGAILAFVSSETATAVASCGPDYQPGLGTCEHYYDLPDGSMIVRIERYALPGHGMQSIAYDVGTGWDPVEVAGMTGAYKDPYTDPIVSATGHTVAWEFAAPGDATAHYTVVATDNGYPGAARVLENLITTVAVNSPYTSGEPIDENTAEDIANYFFAGVHEQDNIGGLTLRSTLITDTASGRSVWQVEISAPVTEPAGGATYTSAFKLSIDALTGAVRVVGQG
jgi:hypothetical protein